MKLLFLVRKLDVGGSERQLIALVRGLVEQGHEASVITWYSGGVLEKALGELGVQVGDLGKRGKWDNLLLLPRLFAVVRTFHPDIIQSVLPATNVVALPLKLAFPQMPIVWGVRSTLVGSAGYGWRRGLLIWLEAKLARFASGIIINSEAGARAAIHRGIPRRKVTVIPNGINVHTFRPDRQKGLALRVSWGVLANERLIGMVARLDPIKDHPMFLHAAKDLILRRPGTRFVLIGDGKPTYVKQLRALANQLGVGEKIIWAGEQYDMGAVYNALDVSTLTSLSEGFPNTLAESMACGVPCVATDVGDVSVILGGTGQVVASGDVGALVEAWITLLEKPGPVGRHAREHVVRLFDERHLLSKTIGVYERAIAGEWPPG